MYKLTRPDGFDFYSGTINYRDAIGTTIRIANFDPKEKGPCGRGLHASKNPNDCFVGAKIPCSAFMVDGIQLIAKDDQKSRYQALKIIEEITDLDTLFGWRYSEAINPVNPIRIDPPEITANHISILEKWDSVRDSVWASVRDSVRASVRDSVRDSVWDSVWASVWDSVWDSVWASVRDSVRDSAWDSVWDSVWAGVWDSVWDRVWGYIGSLFPNIKKWKYIKHESGEYPFQPAVDLWRLGLVPSFDEKTWRLHGGKKAAILWEGPI